MATPFIYRNVGTNQMVYVSSPVFDGNPLWEPILSGSAGGVTQAELDAVENDTTGPHGIADFADLLTDDEATAKVQAHNLEITSVHGVADMTELITSADADDKVTAHTGASDPHGDRADTTAKISTHAAAVDPHSDRSFATLAIATHAGAVDPHGDRAYTDDATDLLVPLIQKGAANGVATLDGSTKLTAAQIPPLPGTAITSGTVDYARLPVGTTASTVAAGDVTTTALATKAGKGDLVLNVLDYGAIGNGSADDTPAFTAAIAAAVTLKREVFIPGGNYKITGAGLALPSSVTIRGMGRGRSVLTYTGTGTAISNATPGVRIFELHIADLYLTTTTGAIGFDLDSVSTSTFTNVVATGFSDSGFYIHSSVLGGSVYNRFTNTSASVCATGYKLRGDSSNANVWWGCRAVACASIGFDLQESNDNTVTASQIEGCGTAVYLNGSTLGAHDSTRLRDIRIENCTVGIHIASANVRKTYIDGLWIDGSTTTPITDLGTQTRRAGQFMSVNQAGTILTLDSGVSVVGGASFFLGTSSSAFAAATNASLFLRGGVPDNSAAVAAWIGNTNTLTAAGGRIAGFCRDTAVSHAQPASYVDLDGSYEFASNGVKVMSGTGTPEGAVTAPVGSLFLRSNGGAGTCMYVKESGAGNTGWIAK